MIEMGYAVPSMPRRLLAAFVLAIAFFVARAAAAETNAAPSIDLYTVGAGDYFYARFGHAVLCVRPDGAKVEDATATCYDYGVPDREGFFHVGWSAIRGEVGFVPVAVPEKTVLAFFEGQGRSVDRQHLPLMPDEAARLAKRLEDDVVRKKGYAYHPYWANCTTALRDHLDAVTSGRLHPGPFTPEPGKFRELAEEGLSGRLLELTALALVLGNATNDRVPSGWESMYLPANLRDGVRDRLGAPIEKVAERQAIVLPTSRAIGRMALFFVAFAVSFAVRFAARRKRVRAALFIAGTTLGLLGTFVAATSAIVVWPELRHNYALLVLVPTDLALPFLLTPSRKKILVAYARVRIAVAIVIGVLELASVIAQPTLPLVALVVFPMAAVLRAVRAEDDEKAVAADAATSAARA